MNALVAWLWQGAAIALATAILLASMRRLNAATRHVIWWCALGVVVVAPLVRMDLGATAVTTSVVTSTLPSRVVVLPTPPDSVIAIAIGVWLGTLLVGFGKIATGLKLLARLKSESSPLALARESRLPMWQSAVADRRRPQLRVSQGMHAACALGLGRPVIVLSQRLVDALDDAALDQVVMHEYAHLLRHDDWLRLIESIIVSLVGLHPAVKFIARQIDLEREAACDDIVVSRTGGALAYAACLTDAAALAAGDTAAAERLLAPGATGASVSLRRRVLRLLDGRRARSARLAPVAVTAGLLTVASMLALSHGVAPIFVVDTQVIATAPPVPRAIVAPAASALPVTGAAYQIAATAARTDVNGGRSGIERQSVPGPGDTPSVTQLAPSEVVTKFSSSGPDVAPAPLASSTITSGVHTPVALYSAVRGQSAGDDRHDAGVKWSSLGAPGVAVGRGAKSIAGLFGGAAKAVAGSF